MKCKKKKKIPFYITMHIFHVFLYSICMLMSYYVRPITVHSILTNHILSQSILINHTQSSHIRSIKACVISFRPITNNFLTFDLSKSFSFHFNQSHIVISHLNNHSLSYYISNNSIKSYPIGPITARKNKQTE